MNPRDFVFWLEGIIDGEKYIGDDKLIIIREKIKEINFNEFSRSDWFIRSNSGDKVELPLPGNINSYKTK
jgi:hypothetical protein